MAARLRLAAVPVAPAEPGRGRLPDRRVAVGTGLVAVRRLLGRPAAGADRPVRAGRRGRRPVGAAGARVASPWWPRSCSPALVGRLAAPATRIGLVLAAGTAAIFTATPLFGGSVVNSELLGPAVHPGRAAPRSSPRRRRSADGTRSRSPRAGRRRGHARRAHQAEPARRLRGRAGRWCSLTRRRCCSPASPSARCSRPRGRVQVSRGLGTSRRRPVGRPGHLPPGGRRR